MAWTTLLNAIFGVGRPITGATGIALRDNAIAIAQGLSGAPKIAVKASVGTSAGGSPGSLIVTTSGLDDFGGIDCRGGVTMGGSGLQQLILQLSNDGVNFYGGQVLYSVTGGGNVLSFDFYVNFADGSYIARVSPGGLASSAVAGTIPGSSLAVKAVRITASGSGVQQPAAIFFYNGGSQP